MVQANRGLTLLLAFLVAGAESVIGLSLFVPSTVIFLSMAAVFEASGHDSIMLWATAAIGASAGDLVGYAIGYHLQGDAQRIWPLSRKPEILAAGQRFFARWGILSILICRFLGPARSVVMLVAGLCRMPLLRFIPASLVSAAIWAAAVLGPGVIGVRWLLG